MQYLSRLYAVLFIALILSGCNNETPVSSEVLGDGLAVLAKQQERGEVDFFQAAGPAGANGVLTEGDIFPPTKGGFAILHRGNDWVSYNLHTTGLPAGAYTNWWIIFNNPEECSGVPCGLGDLGNALVNPSVFWSTGGIVQDNGVGNFQATIDEGEPSKGPDGFLVGTDGLVDAAKAEVHIIIKYHGPASNDPDELFLQTNTVLGLCDDRANALPDGNCFDPQGVPIL